MGGGGGAAQATPYLLAAPLHPGSIPTWLPSQQTRSSSLIPTLLRVYPPPGNYSPSPTPRPQPGFSNRPAGKERRRGGRGGQREILRLRERFPVSLLSSPRLFQNAYCTPALPALSSSSVWGTPLEATPNQLIAQRTPSRFGQAGEDALLPVHAA